MSYSRSYSEIVSKVVGKTVSYNYPASEHGGSGSIYVEIEAEIPVDVNIHVDTNPFDRSVQHCDNNVDLLTASVVATETAEIASKEQNSHKVASTVISGFFSYIRSEISQQVAELSQHIDAHLMHLKELAQACLAKKTQMEVDFNRISSRYVKIFEDLNNELSNRIFEMDRPAFLFKKETDNQQIRTSDNDLVNIVAIFGTESSDLQTKISSSIAKKRALDTINKAIIFLKQQKSLNTTIKQSMLNESISGSIFAPVCLLETRNFTNQLEKRVFNPEYLTILNGKSQKNELINKFSSKVVKWGKLTQDDQKSIRLYFNTELNRRLVANDQHSVRVREMIKKLTNIPSINAISLK